jgi:hypothetical protein
VAKTCDGQCRIKKSLGHWSLATGPCCSCFASTQLLCETVISNQNASCNYVAFVLKSIKFFSSSMDMVQGQRFVDDGFTDSTVWAG